MMVLLVAALVVGAALVTGSATVFVASRRRGYVGQHRARF